MCNSNEKIVKKAYNLEQKNEYIDGESRYSSAKNGEIFITRAKRLFDLTEEYEKEFGCDLADFNKTQLIGTMQKILSGGLTYQNGCLQLLKNYIGWCIKNEKSSQSENYLNGLVLSKFETLNGYKNVAFATSDDFYQFLDDNFNDLSLNTPDNLIRCFLVLLFEGLIVEEAVDLKDEDINLTTGVITLPSKEIVLSHNALKVVKYVACMTDITTASGDDKTNYDQPINDYGYVIETSSNSEEARTPKYRQGGFSDYLLARVSAKSKVYKDKNITPLKIMDCGVFIRAFEVEKQTGEVDLTEFLKQRMERGNKTAFTAPDIVLSQGELEYQKWKKAFDL